MALLSLAFIIISVIGHVVWDLLKFIFKLCIKAILLPFRTPLTLPMSPDLKHMREPIGEDHGGQSGKMHKN